MLVRSAAAAALLVFSTDASFAADGAGAPAKAALRVPENPREAGARYGQAAGVALLCYGMMTTAASDELKSKYQGEALAAFNDQAERILAMWKDTLSCKNAGGPNQCRLSHAFSCAEAMKEIGPNGTKLPGLVDEKQPGAAAAVNPSDASGVQGNE